MLLVGTPIETLKIHKIGWCEVGLKLEGILTNNVNENNLNNIMEYIMVSLDN